MLGASANDGATTTAVASALTLVSEPPLDERTVAVATSLKRWRAGTLKSACEQKKVSDVPGATLWGELGVKVR